MVLYNDTYYSMFIAITSYLNSITKDTKELVYEIWYYFTMSEKDELYIPDTTINSSFY